MARRRGAALAGAATVIGLLGFLDPSSADQVVTARATTEKQKVTPAFEAWYQADPTCQTPVGCLGSTLPVPPPTIYPARSLHVGQLGGQEIARTYLAFYLDDPTAELLSAEISIPLDTSPESGSQIPDQSRVQACTYTGSFINADGSLDTPPEANCDDAVLLEYVAEPQPRLTGNLEPLLTALPQASGLVLMPATLDVEEPGAGTWRVVFSAGDRQDAPTAPAQLKLAVKPVEASTEPPAQSGGGTPSTGAGGSGPGPAVVPGGSGNLGSAPVEAAPPVKAGDDAPAPAVPEAAPYVEPLTEFVGYAYPMSWLIPLLVMALVVLAGRELTRELVAPRR